MVYRYAWLAGIAGIAVALVRLDALVQDTVEGAPWQLVVVAGAILGAVITWTALAYRIHSAFIVVLNLVVFVFIAARIAVPDTTSALLPTMDSVRAMRVELSYALDLIGSGVAPVIPASGLVVVLTAVFWALGALLVWGLQTARPYVALVPPMLVYLQLATADRGFAGLGWALVLLALIAGSLAAVTLDERAARTGRLARGRGVPLGGVVSSTSFVTLASAVVVAVFATAALASTVSPTGVIDWRHSSGLTGDYFGSIAFNPFASIQKSLVSRSNTPLFTARIEGDVDPEDVYWKFLTLDTFNGVWWFADEPQMTRLDEGGSFEDRALRFAGPATEVIQEVTIQRLRNDWLPAAYAAREFVIGNEQVERSIRIAGDSSIRFGSRSFPGMQYVVRSEIPRPDIAALAVDEEGVPTPAFAEVFLRGTLEVPADPPQRREVDVERFTQLPDEIDPRIGATARAITLGLASDYERGLALEAWFREPENGFRYSVDIPPGEDSADLGAWLFDPDNPNFRLGYCEQYATSMGAMARAVGIPSRVVLGFTPGRLLDDGSVVVLDNNAHAWVELWMPAQGWVRFDPTPRGDGVNPATVDDVVEEIDFDLLPLLRPEDLVTPDFEAGPLPPTELFEDEFPPPVVGPSGGEPGGAPFRLPGWVDNAALITALLVLAVGAIPSLKWWRRRRRLRRLSRGDVTAAWEEIVSRLSDLGDRPSPADTPLEVATRTDTALRPLAAVYSEAVYGPTGTVGAARVETAARSFAATEASFQMRYSPAVRALAWYRPGSLLPRRRRGRT